MAAHSLSVRAAPTPAASSAPECCSAGLRASGLGADLGAPLDRVLGGALRRGAGAPKGGAAPPVAEEEAAALVGAAMPSSSIACAAGFGAGAGRFSADGLRGLRGLPAGPSVLPPSNVRTCAPRMVGGPSGDISPPDSPSKPPASASTPSEASRSEIASSLISYLVWLSHEESRAWLGLGLGLGLRLGFGFGFGLGLGFGFGLGLDLGLGLKG
jgi:hypothetical protein